MANDDELVEAFADGGDDEECECVRLPNNDTELTKEDLQPGTLEHPKEWGIFDTKHKSWMGTAT